MLVAANASPEGHLQTIQAFTAGIIFMGTPHSGSALAHSAERLAKLLGVVMTTNPKIIRVLRKDSEVLARIQNEFHSLIRTRLQDPLSAIEITCFYEELPLPGIGEVRKKHIQNMMKESIDMMFRLSLKTRQSFTGIRR